MREREKIERMKAFVYFSEGLTVSSRVIYYHTALSLISSFRLYIL